MGRRPGGEREDAWLADVLSGGLDAEVAPGLTAREYAVFHARPDDPSGAVFESHAYTTADGRQLPIYVYRRDDRAASRPGVVLVHGGGWQESTPFMLVRHAHRLAEAGYVAACPAYRLSGEARWPAQLDDVVAATGWLQAQGRTLGLDGERLAAVGNSAGGHIAFFLAAECAAVRVAVLLYPVVDLRTDARGPLADSGAIEALLGSRDDDATAAASPVDQVRPGLPPIYTFVGEADELTPPEAAIRFHAALEAAGVENQLAVLPGLGHAYDLAPANWPAASEAVVSIIGRHVPVAPLAR